MGETESSLDLSQIKVGRVACRSALMKTSEQCFRVTGYLYRYFTQ